MSYSTDWVFLDEMCFITMNEEFKGRNGTLESGEKVIEKIQADLESPLAIKDGTLYVTNFKIQFLYQNTEGEWTSENITIVPLFSICFLKSINNAGKRNGPVLHIKTRDLRVLQFVFKDDEGKYRLVYESIEARAFWRKPHCLSSMKQFIFAFFHEFPPSNNGLYNPKQEFNRLKFEALDIKCSDWNKDYKICSTYPKLLFFPVKATEGMIKDSAHFRSGRRLPVICWAHKKSRAILSRSAQPMRGCTQHFSLQDEALVALLQAPKSGELMRVSAPSPDTPPSYSHFIKNSINMSILGFSTAESIDDSNVGLYIMDARSNINAMGNLVGKGGGYENIGRYHHCALQFMNVPNIHTIRQYYKAMTDKLRQSNNEQNVNDWLSTIKILIDGANTIKILLDKGKSVLAHCSDGWDRTSQLVSLTEILLDPYFRTIKGFGILVQKEWLQFGHKFSERAGHGVVEDHNNEQSPIFFQFLDAVYQLTYEFPDAFQFNELYLLTLVDELYTGRFGTFLMDNESEREVYGTDLLPSLWPWILENKKKYINPNYNQQLTSSLTPTTNDLKLWKGYFERYKVGTNKIQDVILERNCKTYPADEKEELDDLPQSDDALGLMVPYTPSSPKPIKRQTDETCITQVDSSWDPTRNWNFANCSPVITKHHPDTLLTDSIQEDYNPNGGLLEKDNSPCGFHVMNPSPTNITNRGWSSYFQMKT